VRLTVTGRRSHITRAVYVYLPPQYFQPAYRAYRFPAIELIHGQPGQPQDWISVLGVTGEPDAPLTFTPGSGHSMVTWRAEVPPLLTWMTRGLARAATARPVRARPATAGRPATVLAAAQPAAG